MGGCLKNTFQTAFFCGGTTKFETNYYSKYLKFERTPQKLRPRKGIGIFKKKDYEC